MKLNRDGFIAKFYAWTYGLSFCELPKDFCSFFWKLLFAFVALPLTVWSLVFAGLFPSMRRNSEWDLLGRILSPVAVFGSTYFASRYIGALLDYPSLTIQWTGIIVGLCLIILLIVGAACAILYSLLSGEVEPVEIIKTKISSVKDSYCPRIDWYRGE